MSALVLALIAGAVVGLALGALGGGGSVLAVPALIYLLGFTPAAATTASLLIVTATSATALYAHARTGHVRWKAGAAFAAAGLFPAALAGAAAARLPQAVLTAAFAAVAALAAVKMLRPAPAAGPSKTGPVRAAGTGAGLGALTGLLGVGGGFLAVPALVTVLAFEMQAAVGTSLLDALALPWSRTGEHRSARFAAWGERLWRRPVLFGAAALVVSIALAAPVLGLRTAMPSITVLPGDASARAGYTAVQDAFGPGAPGTLQILTPTGQAATVTDQLKNTDGIAGVMPAQAATDHSGLSLIQAVPTVDPSDPALATTVDHLRADLPDKALIGGAAVENLDLQHLLTDKTPLVIGVVLALGFILLLVALQAPLIAALGTLTSLLSTGAAFGAARLIFQDGHGANLLGFTSQGFLDGWAPVFFFAMIFAIAMDYTVFLLASAKEHYEKTGDPRDAMTGSLAHSGRIIFAAAVMVAVFFTFALSGPLPPKEMGVILGIAVLLDAALVRLVLLPVLLRLTGHAAWWSPAWLRRLLPDIRFAH